MEREVQKISLATVWRQAYSVFTHQEEPIGELFAFDADILERQARAGEMSSHELLLRMIVKGLWEARPKRPVLAGYMPGSEQTPVCRIYVMAARPIALGPFHKSLNTLPGYIESGSGYISWPQHCPTVWWEYPCTMVALWPRPTEEDAQFEAWIRLGGPGEEHGWFYSDDKCYRLINRYYVLSE